MFTTAMFHYVRNRNTHYKVNYFSEKNFLNLIKKKFKKNLINPKDVFEKRKIRNNKVLLTFDDGYKDHYTLCEKYFDEEKAIFFLNGKTIEKKEFLDVNKIQLIANNFSNKKELMSITENLINKNLKKKFLLKNLPVESKIYRPFDTKEISMFKFIFQIFLPLKLSTNLLNEIFFNYLKINHKAVFKNLYLNINEIQEMKKKGMVFGNHTYNHYPLTKLNYRQQYYEIKRNHDFLVKYDLLNYNIFAYPYGVYDNTTLKILKKLNYKFAFTIKKNKSNLKNPLLLSRMDANFL